MSLPNNYTIHFRFAEKYVNIGKDSLDKMKGKTCNIFFSKGNDLSIQEKDRKVNDICIREATIIDVDKIEILVYIIFI